MYRYDEFDHAFVHERVSQFREQVGRRLAGKLTEEEWFGGSALAHGRATGHAVVERDLHGIDGDHAALGDGLGSFALQRLGLLPRCQRAWRGRPSTPATVQGRRRCRRCGWR